MLNLKSLGVSLAASALLCAPVLASEKEDSELKKGWYFYGGGGGTVIQIVKLPVPDPAK